MWCVYAQIDGCVLAMDSYEAVVDSGRTHRTQSDSPKGRL